MVLEKEIDATKNHGGDNITILLIVAKSKEGSSKKRSGSSKKMMEQKIHSSITQNKSDVANELASSNKKNHWFQQKLKSLVRAQSGSSKIGSWFQHVALLVAAKGVGRFQQGVTGSPCRL